MFSVRINRKKEATKHWETKQGGYVHAVSSGGQVTGFRAGYIKNKGEKIFTGALIIDDPLKPGDAASKTKRKEVNNKYSTTHQSRLATEDVPVIIVMQRLHPQDLCGHLLTGGSGEQWYHLILPAMIEKNPEYPEEYKYGLPVKYKLPAGPLWELKHNKKRIQELKDSDEFVYIAQYEQSPRLPDGSVIKRKYLHYYKEVPEFDYEL